MKKKFVICLPCILLICTSILLLKIKLANQNMHINPLKDINMIIKEKSLTNTSAIVIITDKTNHNNTYNEWYRIDKNHGRWKKLKNEDDWVNLVGYHVDENNQIEFQMNWNLKYGALKKGRYRLVKEVNNQYISIEFTIS